MKLSSPACVTYICITDLSSLRYKIELARCRSRNREIQNFNEYKTR